MSKIKFSTIEVPSNNVNLGYTQFLKYAIPHDRTGDFEKIVDEELQNLKTLFREHGYEENIMQVIKESEKKIAIYRHYRALQKINSAIELIRAEFESGAYKKLVVFAKHRDVIQYLQIGLPEYGPVTMYAKSNPHKIEQAIKNFNNPKHKCKIFISTVRAAKDPIILNVAQHVFFLEEELDPKDNLDAILRCKENDKDHRIFVRNFCLDSDSVDRRLQELIRTRITKGEMSDENIV